MLEILLFRILAVLLMPLFFSCFVAEGLVRLFGLNSDFVALIPCEAGSILTSSRNNSVISTSK